jgi:hypothetical protein
MIEQKHSLDELPKEIRPAFQELKILKHLNACGFQKEIWLYLRPSVPYRRFCTVAFQQKNWIHLLESNKGETFPGKDMAALFVLA